MDRRQMIDQACQAIDQVVEYHRSSKNIQAGMTLGLVTEDGLIWSKGWGKVDVFGPNDETNFVDPHHVFRVGSISKLFTDIAIMRLVELGELSLDLPVENYLPSFKPNNPFINPITLRNLMSHHSGLPREPPKGNYADNSESNDLEATTSSINSLTVLFEPNTRYKYSNAALGLVGRILEVVTGDSFAEHLQKHFFNDLQMFSTSFLPLPHLMKELCQGYMWTYENHQEQVAPMFELGEAPAGSMFSNVFDLSNFVEMLCSNGNFRGKQIISKASLDEMYRNQFQDAPIGLGFVSKIVDGVRLVGHSGAIYGYSADLVVAPELKIGFVSMIGLDAANSILSHMARVALHTLLPIYKNGFLPSLTSLFYQGPILKIDPLIRKAIKGLYIIEKTNNMETQQFEEHDLLHPKLEWIYFLTTEKNLQVFYNGTRLNTRFIPHDVPSHKILPKHEVIRLTPDDRLLCGVEEMLYFDVYYNLETYLVDHIEHDGQSYKKAPETTLTPKSARKAIIHELHEIQPLLGEYGPPHSPIFVFEREKQLVVQIEWFCICVMQKVSPLLYRFPDDSLYSFETLKFVMPTEDEQYQLEQAQQKKDSKQVDSKVESKLISVKISKSANKASAVILSDSIRFDRVKPRNYSKFEEFEFI